MALPDRLLRLRSKVVMVSRLDQESERVPAINLSAMPQSRRCQTSLLLTPLQDVARSQSCASHDEPVDCRVKTPGYRTLQACSAKVQAAWYACSQKAMRVTVVPVQAVRAELSQASVAAYARHSTLVGGCILQQ